MQVFGVSLAGLIRIAGGRSIGRFSALTCRCSADPWSDRVSNEVAMRCTAEAMRQALREAHRSGDVCLVVPFPMEDPDWRHTMLEFGRVVGSVGLSVGAFVTRSAIARSERRAEDKTPAWFVDAHPEGFLLQRLDASGQRFVGHDIAGMMSAIESSVADLFMDEREQHRFLDDEAQGRLAGWLDEVLHTGELGAQPEVTWDSPTERKPIGSSVLRAGIEQHTREAADKLMNACRQLEANGAVRLVFAKGLRIGWV